LRGIESHLDEIERAGVRPVAISVDSPDVSRGLCQRRGYSYTFLSDPKAEVIRRYDLLHPGWSKMDSNCRFVRVILVRHVIEALEVCFSPRPKSTRAMAKRRKFTQGTSLVIGNWANRNG
jgi:peroxiredoxin